MTQRFSSRRRASTGWLLLILLALVALLAAACVLTRSATPATLPTTTAEQASRATEPSPSANGFLAGELATLAAPPAPLPTTSGFEAGVATGEPSGAQAGFTVKPGASPRSTRQPSATLRPTQTPAAIPRPTSTRGAAPSPTKSLQATATPKDGLSTIAFAKLPREAQDTIRLIDRGGPFPYRQDGAIFQNRERLLPIKPSGYYHEYTVETPGSPDRGPRRIVTGDGGELYYTADHYDSFKRVAR